VNAEILVEQAAGFAAEMDHFSACLLYGTTRRMPGEMALSAMRNVVPGAATARIGKAVKV